jgi:hypothetical protein
MEISIRSVDAVSALSGNPFTPGDRVWSYLLRTTDGQLERMDILDNEREQLQPEGQIVCKWSHRIKDRDSSESEARRAALQSAEEVFLSLFEDLPGGEDTGDVEDTRARLKFFLALQLQRKRILKPLGKGRFKHMPTGRELMVPEIEITPELIAVFQQEIALMGMPC